MIEERVLPGCDAITGVSTSLLQELQDRYPALRERPSLVLPIGIDPHDLEWVRAHPQPLSAFDPQDGHFHMCAVGTLLPLAIAPLRATFAAIAALRTHDPRRVRKAAAALHRDEQSGGCRGGAASHADRAGARRRRSGDGAAGENSVCRRVAAATRRVGAAGAGQHRGTLHGEQGGASRWPPGGRRWWWRTPTATSSICMHRVSAGAPAIRVAPFRDHPDDATSCIRRVLDDWLSERPAGHDGRAFIDDLTGPSLARQLGHLLGSLTENARG